MKLMLSERLKRSKSLNRKLNKKLISLKCKRSILLKQSKRQAYQILIARFGLKMKSRKILRDIKNNSEKKKKKYARELKK